MKKPEEIILKSLQIYKKKQISKNHSHEASSEQNCVRRNYDDCALMTADFQSPTDSTFVIVAGKIAHSSLETNAQKELAGNSQLSRLAEFANAYRLRRNASRGVAKRQG